MNSARIVHPWSKATKYWLTIICAVAICEERSMSHKFIPFSLTDKCVRFWCQDGAMLCAWVLTYESRLRHFQKNKVEGCKTNRFFSIVYSKVQFECFFLSFLCGVQTFESSFRSSWFPTGGISLIFPSAFLDEEGAFFTLVFPLLTFTLKSLYEQFITLERQVPWLSSHLGGTQKMTKCPRQSSTFSHILDDLRLNMQDKYQLYSFILLRLLFFVVINRIL